MTNVIELGAMIVGGNKCLKKCVKWYDFFFSEKPDHANFFLEEERVVERRAFQVAKQSGG